MITRNYYALPLTFIPVEMAEGKPLTSPRVLPSSSEAYNVSIQDDNIIEWNANEDKRLACENNLWYWNLSCSILHFIEAII